MNQKYEKLKEIIASYGSVAVAFSGGVDSTLLLQAAHDALDDKVIAISAKSPSFPKRELQEAMDFAEQLGVTHILVKSNELEIEGFSHNPVNRCYLCKNELFGKIINAAKSLGVTTLLEGSNLDDDGDYRPGKQAIKELGVKSPLRDAGLTKADIREISKELGLPTWNKQSFACLNTRFPYGDEITIELLERVDKAEQFLLDAGFKQVRVRVHKNIARIEVPANEMDALYNFSKKGTLVPYFQEIGFDFVALDLEGYKTGSMNKGLE